MYQKNILHNYVYEDFTREREIRLLRLEQRVPFQTLNTSLITMSLDKLPSYEAISYQWAGCEKASTIIVNGLSLPVSLRVRKILDDLSSRKRERLIWIDSICINQGNLEERSKQVILMGDVYKGATEVLVWLEKAKQPTTLVSIVFPHIEMATRVQQNGRQLKKARFYGTTITAILDFINNPYWFRTWIIQEIALGRSVRILYRGASLSWEDYFLAIKAFIPRLSHGVIQLHQCFSTKHVIGFARGLGPSCMIQLLRDWHRMNKSQRLKFRNVIWNIVGSTASDPRDKIYGVLGLIEDGGSRLLVPDYTKSVQDVYRDATLYLISGEDPLRFLHFAGLRADKTAGLESWVPDWSLYPEAACLGLPDHPAPYKASGEMAAPTSIGPISSSIIRLDAIFVDVIEHVADIAIQLHSHKRLKSVVSWYELEVLRWHHEAFGLAITGLTDALSDYGNGQTRHEAFWRTVCGNRQKLRASLKHAPDKFSHTWGLCHKLFKSGLADLGFFLLDKFKKLGRERKSIMNVHRNSDEAQKDADSFEGAVGQAAFGRKFAITKHRRMALVPQSTKPGDEIWVVLGSETPHCLRRQYDETLDVLESKNVFQLVGECYVHGIMDGEAVQNGKPVENIFLK